MKDRYIDHYGIDSLPNLKEASRAGCTVFVTTNKALLEDRAELEKRFNIKIRDPEEAVKEIEAAE